MYQIIVLWSEDDSRPSTYTFEVESHAIAFKQALDEINHHLAVTPFAVSKGSWQPTRPSSKASLLGISLMAALWSIVWWYLLTSSQNLSEYVALGLISGSAHYLASLFLLKTKSLF